MALTFQYAQWVQSIHAIARPDSIGIARAPSGITPLVLIIESSLQAICSAVGGSFIRIVVL